MKHGLFDDHLDIVYRQQISVNWLHFFHLLTASVNKRGRGDDEECFDDDCWLHVMPFGTLSNPGEMMFVNSII